MRAPSSEISDSLAAETTRRRKHRRRILPSQSITQEEDGYGEEDESTRPNSHRYDSNYGDEADDEDGLGHTTEPESSYSDSRSSSANSCSWSPDRSTPTTRRATPPTYMNVAPLPIFRGAPGECPVEHLSRFARVCRANNASTAEMMARIFPVTLDGEAALWCELEVEPRYPSVSWEEIKSSFLAAYRRAEFADRSRSELMAMRQGDHETVTAYRLRMQWILKKWPEHGISDAMLRGIFVDGLKEDFQDWIVPQRPNSLEEAFRLALSWEQAQSLRAARRRNVASGAETAGPVVKCGFCDGPHEEGACDVRRKMRELWLKSRERQEEPSSPPKIGGGELARSSNGGNLGSLSPSASMVRREGEEGKGGGGILSFRRRSQCQCWKHQCWKKYERSNSGLLEGNPTTD